MTTEQITGEQDGNPLFEAFDSWLWSACSCDTEVGWTCGAHKNAQPLRLALQDIMALHSEFKIYEECECAERDEEGHLLSDPEWSEFAFCAKSFMYLICRECCTDGEDTEMTEECADHHNHGEGRPICKTHRAITNRLGE